MLWLQYHSFSSDELTERKIEPYSLIFYGEDWHVVGYCRLRGVSPTRTSQEDGVARQLGQIDDRDFGVRPHPRKLLNAPDGAGTILGGLGVACGILGLAFWGFGMAGRRF